MYACIGFVLWNSTNSGGTSYQEIISSILFIILLWPLAVGYMIFYSLALPVVLLTVLSVFLAIKRRFAIAFTIFISVIIILSTLFLPVTINNQHDLVAVTMGKPIAFFIQDQSKIDPPFPWRTHIWSANENPSEILWVQFLVSLVITVIIVYGIMRAIVSSHRIYQMHRGKEEVETI